MPLTEFKNGIRHRDPAVRWAWFVMILLCLLINGLAAYGLYSLISWLTS